MLARIAHELFWLGRNISRAEHTARLIDGVFQADVQAYHEDPYGVTLSWDAVLAIMGSTATSSHGRASRDETVALLSTDDTNVNSVVASVARAREGARTVRDVISAEMWEAINGFQLGLGEAAIGVTGYAGPYSFVSYVKSRSALFWGVASRTMLRDEAYSFLDAGGRFEGADMVLRMLRAALPSPGEDETTVHNVASLRDGQALALLQAVGGLQAYRRSSASAPSAAAVAGFLLFTPSYPDSVAASVGAVRDALLLADHAPRSSDPVLRLSRILADLGFRARSAAEGSLLAVCEQVGSELALADTDISERYFGGVAPAERLMTTT
ncbi:MAG: alpha-E domain-containing protein [Solirubrobacteraceae bacterium]